MFNKAINALITKTIFPAFCLAMSLVLSKGVSAQKSTAETPITLPTGFKSIIVGRNLNHARHIVVNSNGDIYVKLEQLKKGKGIIRLRAKKNDGIINDTTAFGDYVGTGIALKNNYLYASSNTTVYRYKLNNNEPDIDHPEIIVKGLIDGGQHNSKSITLDNAGYIYVNIGAPSNACQVEDRVVGSPGIDPCPLLEKAGGIWRFKADKQNQSYSEGTRYATGIRNVVGLDWNTATNTLFVMQHNRDALQDYHFYSDSISVNLPAEEMLEIKHEGDNFGWPYCFFNQYENKKMLNPEYGGDGKKIGRCEGMKAPVAAYPGHMAPNGLLFYTGSQFPKKYKGGAFIAFHGSWNRAPFEQNGFCVAFQPFKNGKPDGAYEIFASGFAGRTHVTSPAQAIHRPCGLAQGPDGSIYVTDDVKGTVWKISYHTK